MENEEANITVTYLDRKEKFRVNLSDQFEIFAYQLLSVFEGVPLELQYVDGLSMNSGDSLKESGIKSEGNYYLKKDVAANGALQQEMVGALAGSLQNVMQYTDPATMALCKSKVPLKILEQRAEDNVFKLADPRDEFIVQLLKWFKQEFFTWVNEKPCQSCKGKTANRGMLTPYPDELKYGANRVENHYCDKCHLSTRFPRYNVVTKLLETREGRCGEWANCFTAICVALGYEARYVRDWTDHVWTEVHSVSLDRFVHCDSCEAAWDTPLVYESGWGKKVSYVMAFSGREVVDVTQRYTQSYGLVLARRLLLSEKELREKLMILNATLRTSMDDWTVIQLQERQEKERLDFPLTAQRALSEAELAGRTSGSKEWREERGEMGSMTSTIRELKLDNATKLFSLGRDTKFDQLRLKGDAFVNENNILILTKNECDKSGAAWYTQTINIDDDFLATFTLCIGPRGADGMAFVIQAEGLDALGDKGGGKGYQGIRKSVAIEFGTYGAPDNKYIGIQSRGQQPNSASHDHSLALSDRSLKDFADGRVHYCAVLHRKGEVSVYLDGALILKHKAQLSKLIGTSNAFVGFTAATGGLKQAHEVGSWSLEVVKSGASSQSTNDAPLFPLASFNVINYVLVVKKLLELNKTEEKPLSTEHLNAFQSLVVRLSDETKKVEALGIDAIVHVLTHWNSRNAFPAIDVARMVLLHPDGYLRLVENDGKYLKSITEKLDVLLRGDLATNHMLCLRFYSNLFFKAGELSIDGMNEVIAINLDIYRNSYKRLETKNSNLLASIVSFLLNCALSFRSSKVTSCSVSTMVPLLVEISAEQCDVAIRIDALKAILVLLSHSREFDRSESWTQLLQSLPAGLQPINDEKLVALKDRILKRAKDSL